MPTTLVWRTDLHIADKAPRSRTDDWASTMADKLRQVGRIAREVGACAVIDGGDMFHVKSPWKNSHKLLGQIIEAHRGYPCPTYACVGNHDCVYGDYGFLHQQPLGVLFDAGVLCRLYDEHEFVPDRSEPNDPKVRVVGVPYHGTTYDLDRLSKITKGGEDYLVVVAHLLATPGAGGRGAMFGGEDIVGYDFLSTLDADVFCFGHWHKDQGVVEISPGKWVVNIGSMSRGSLSQDEIARTPAVAVLTFDANGVEIVKRPLSVRPPESVFDFDNKVRASAKEFTMGAFVESLQDALVSSRGSSLEDTIQASGEVLPEVRERALHYLEQVR